MYIRSSLTDMSDPALLGSFDQLPDFVDAASSLGAVVLKPSQFSWSLFEKFGETWTLTRGFLDGCIARHRIFLLLTPPVAAIRGSSYVMELQYLKSKGVPESSFRMARWESRLAGPRKTVNRLALNTLLARKREQRLAEEIHRDLSFLFAENGAQIISQDGLPFPPKFDYAFVTLAVGRVRLRIARGRGDLSVSVASQQKPHDFHELSLLLTISGLSQNLGRRSYVTVSDAARLLREEIHHLQQELSINERSEKIQEELQRFQNIPLGDQLKAID